jgi:ribonuclease VapC
LIAVDTSALVAIALDEPERALFLTEIQRADRALISTVSVIEAKMVVHGRRGSRAVLLLEDMLRLPPFEIVAPSSAEMTAAYAAFALYGKGSGHPAALNFGDLYSYALAKTRGVPLLFKGDDFSQTDLSRA